MKTVLLSALAAVVLSGCGGSAPPMGGKPVSHWQAALKDPDARVRKKAVFKLGNIGSTEAWPVVMATLKDADPRVRAEAVQAILKFGPGATKAVPELEALGRAETDPQVR